MKARLLFLPAILLGIPFLVHASPVDGINSWMEHHLSAGDAGIGSYLFLLMGGVLASFLPCTYPLYPITVNILRSRAGNANKNRIHWCIFWNRFDVFLFGIIASLTGGAFNTVLHFSLTNLLISIIIFILGLSSMDLLYLPIFSGGSMNQQKPD